MCRPPGAVSRMAAFIVCIGLARSAVSRLSAFDSRLLVRHRRRVDDRSPEPGARSPEPSLCDVPLVRFGRKEDGDDRDERHADHVEREGAGAVVGEEQRGDERRQSAGQAPPRAARRATRRCSARACRTAPRGTPPAGRTSPRERTRRRRSAPATRAAATPVSSSQNSGYAHSAVITAPNRYTGRRPTRSDSAPKNGIASSSIPAPIRMPFRTTC